MHILLLQSFVKTPLLELSETKWKGRWAFGMTGSGGWVVVVCLLLLVC